MPYEKEGYAGFNEPLFYPKHSDGGEIPLFDDVRLPFPTTLKELIGSDNPQDFTIPIVATVYGVKVARYLTRAARNKWWQWKLSGQYAWWKAKDLIGCSNKNDKPKLQDYAIVDPEIVKANPFLNHPPESLDPGFSDQRLC